MEETARLQEQEIKRLKSKLFEANTRISALENENKKLLRMANTAFDAAKSTEEVMTKLDELKILIGDRCEAA